MFPHRLSIYRDLRGRHHIRGPRDGWLVKTLQALYEIKNQWKEKKWIYLRLVYTETSLSWTTDDFAYRHMGIVFFVATSATCGALLLARQASSWARRYLDFPTIGVICIIIAPAFTGLVFMIGKYNITPLRGVVEMNKNGCCTQAMIFPRDQVPALVSYLRERKGRQTDSLIEEYADNTKLRRFALAPPRFSMSVFNQAEIILISIHVVRGHFGLKKTILQLYVESISICWRQALLLGWKILSDTKLCTLLDSILKKRYPMNFYLNRYIVAIHMELT